MALNAARTDVTISLVGEDETQQMLQAAAANMSKLENQLKSLTNTTNVHASAAKSASSPLGGFNSGLTKAASVADNAISGIDKVNGVIGKFIGIASMGAPVVLALSGVVALLGIEFNQAEKMASIFTSSMNSAFKAAADAIAKIKAASGSLEKGRPTLSEDEKELDFYEKRIAFLRSQGKEEEALIAEKESVELRARVNREKSIKSEKELLDKEKVNVDERVKTFKKAEAEQLEAKKEAENALWWTKAQLAEIEQGLYKDTYPIQYQKKLKELTTQAALLTADIELADKRTEEIKKESIKAGSEIIQNKKNFVEKAEKIEKDYLIDSVIAEQEADNKLKKYREQNNKESLAEIKKRRLIELNEQERQANVEIDSIRSFFEDREQEYELHEDRMEEIRENALKAEKRAAKEKEKVRKQEEKQKKQREEQVKGIYDFADALKGSLIPELSAVGEVMSKITDQFDLFTEGQISVTQAIAASVTEVLAASARALGGVKAEAAVRAIYELGMGFATLSNPFESAGHFTAAAILGGVATGVISTGGSGSKASGTVSNAVSGNGSTSNGSSSGNGGVNINNYNLSTGVIDGQSTTRAFRRAEQQSRNTGFAQHGGW